MITKCVLLSKVENKNIGRAEVEEVEGSNFTKDEIAKLYVGAEYYTLSDFALMCNDQAIDLEEYWLTFINVYL